MRRMKTQLASALVAVLVSAAAAQAQEAADLNDLEIAHVAYTADNIDIRYAHLALAHWRCSTSSRRSHRTIS